MSKYMFCSDYDDKVGWYSTKEEALKGASEHLYHLIDMGINYHEEKLSIKVYKAIIEMGVKKIRTEGTTHVESIIYEERIN